MNQKPDYLSEEIQEEIKQLGKTDHLGSNVY